jgi:thioredoxin reductase
MIKFSSAREKLLRINPVFSFSSQNIVLFGSDDFPVKAAQNLIKIYQRNLVLVTHRNTSRNHKNELELLFQSLSLPIHYPV